MKTKIILLFSILLLAIFSEDMIEYKVQKGDTLSKISKEFLSDPGNWRELLKYNQIDSPNKIQPGMVMKIPDYLSKKKIVVKNIAKLSKKLGVVKFKKEADVEWKDAEIGQMFASEDTIITKETSAADVTFFDEPNILIQVKENTIMKVKQEKVRSIHLSLGETFIKFLNHAPSKEVKFNVVTPTSVAGVRGTEFKTTTDKDGLDKYECQKGLIQVGAQGVIVEVPEGYGTSVKKGEAPGKPTKLLEKVKIKPIIKQ
jgi:hypothetical protein